jgi:nicotinamidase-related amidase
MLVTEKTIMIVVDVQGNLAHLMYNKDRLFKNLQKIIKGIQTLKIPILWVEQNPEGLGATIPEVADLLPDIIPIKKMSFSGCRNTEFMKALKAENRNQILIVGIETHVCVYQTAVDLVNLDYDVQVVTDAVSSRTAENKNVGLQRMRDAGVKLTSVEMALFELIGIAEGRQFKEIIKIVK